MQAPAIPATVTTPSVTPSPQFSSTIPPPTVVEKPYSVEPPIRTSESRPASYAGDDAAEIKLRLLRLRQKFGYKNEGEENNNSTST
ncbi:hypothetical protein G6F56_012579 [Rhizopus delemar]|nr:hypothetical protein G6F56_012579 [Rhizopus delemar]